MSTNEVQPPDSVLGQLFRTLLAGAVSREIMSREPKGDDWVPVGPGRIVTKKSETGYHFGWTERRGHFKKRELLWVILKDDPSKWLRAKVVACGREGITISFRGLHTLPAELAPGWLASDEQTILSRLRAQLLQGIPMGNDNLALGLLEPSPPCPGHGEELEWNGLDRYQVQAGAYSLGEGVRRVVAGPGAGKTRLLAAITKALTNSRCRSLVVAPSNRATDEAAYAICTALEGSGLRPGVVIRAGEPSSTAFIQAFGERTNPETIAMERFGRAGPEEIQRLIRAASVVVCPTARAWISSEISSERFDSVVQDEGGMTSLAAAYRLAMAADRSLVIVGDSRQLGPVCYSKDRVTRKFFGSSPLDVGPRRSGLSDGHLPALPIQYRMDPPIMNIVNRLSYNNELDVGSEVLQRPNIQGPQLILVDSSPCSPNSEERKGLQSAVHADLVKRSVHYVQEKWGWNPKDAAILARFRDQVRLLRRTIPSSMCAVVGTVHRVQGGEYETVLLDMCAAPTFLGDHIKDQHSQSDGARVLNVGISRAKRRVLVVADVHMIRSYRPFGAETKAQQLVSHLEEHGVVILGDQLPSPR